MEWRKVPAEEQRWLEDCARRCQCCEQCLPGSSCAGVQQGGPCDRMCWCEEQRFYDAMAAECGCCEVCSPGVCGGVLAGGFCDDMCSCGDPD